MSVSLNGEEYVSTDEYITPLFPLLADYLYDMSCKDEGVVKMLQLSTAHLDEKTLALLDNYSLSSVSVYKKTVPGEGVVGYYIPVPEWENVVSAPKSLKDCFYEATRKGCSWLMFDSDIEPIKELDIY